jgi:biotin-dependent carboxylase-like uncharacterized protein
MNRASATSAGLRIERITQLCQLQDLGRRGFLNYGVNISGAMGPYSLRLANILVANPPDLPGLEFALAGAAFEVTCHSIRIAFVGDFPVKIDGVLQPANASYFLRKGAKLEIGRTTGGSHAYLAVSGGFSVKEDLGSCSTHLRTGLGGFGSPLKPGLTLPVNRDRARAAFERYLPPFLNRSMDDRIRVLRGPQWDHFSSAGWAEFLSRPFCIGRNSDRMAYRLTGNPIELAGDGNIISEPVTPGCVQVPANGEPMVLMADCGTVGGYPKIAVVISVDLGRLAQCVPGKEVHFEEVSVQQAQSLLREQEQALNDLMSHQLQS